MSQEKDKEFAVYFTEFEVQLCVEGLKTVYQNRRDYGQLTREEADRYALLVGKLVTSVYQKRD